MTVYRDQDLDGLRQIGALIGESLALLSAAVAPGVTTRELDDRAAEFFTAHGARSGPILTYDYPGFICISVNDEVVHGIPNGRALKDGDLVTLDVATELNGYNGDAATTVAVGAVSPAAQRIMAATRAALSAGLKAAQPGARLGDIGAAVQRVSEARGFSVFRELTGHGIGRSMHEEPTIFNFVSDDPGSDLILEEGMVFTIEPMLSAGSNRLSKGADGWTLSAADGSLTAHEEHTIVVTSGGPEILTASA